MHGYEIKNQNSCKNKTASQEDTTFYLLNHCVCAVIHYTKKIITQPIISKLRHIQVKITTVK